MLDLDFVRPQFPALDNPWVLFDNAGGSAPCRQVIDRVSHYMAHHPVQLGATYGLSVEAREAVSAGRRAVARLFGAEQEEIILGASSTVLAQLLARSLGAAWGAGDEVIVTNVDHEANIGPWRRLEEQGVVVREWRVREGTLDLHPEDLDALLSERTRLVAFTHCSNIVGTIVDVPALTARIRRAGALSCVDGVALAPHRHVDVKALGADFYLVSLYKVYGPHLGLMYGRREELLAAASQNHECVPATALPVKLEPGNVSYELAASLAGIEEYLAGLAAHHGGGEPGDARAGFELVADQEAALVAPLLDFLAAHPRVRVLGHVDADRDLRVPTVSFTVDGKRSSEVTVALDREGLAARHGHFYAYRLIRDLELLDRDGVVRVSLAHYNSAGEVQRLIGALGKVL